MAGKSNDEIADVYTKVLVTSIIGWIFELLLAAPITYPVMLGLGDLHDTWKTFPAWSYWTVYAVVLLISCVGRLFGGTAWFMRRGGDKG